MVSINFVDRRSAPYRFICLLLLKDILSLSVSVCVTDKRKIYYKKFSS